MKLWLVVVQDKALEGEPDVGIAVVEGNRLAAEHVCSDMEDACNRAGRARCVGRVREVERGRQYRATALVRTSR